MRESSSNLILHVDGSQVRAKDKTLSFGWAVVALHDDEHHETWGQLRVGKVSHLLGHHEHIAFIQGVLYARSAGFDLEGASIYCDCDIFGYAPTFLHPENYCQHRRDQLTSRLHTVAAHAFTREVVAPVMHALRHSRITKLKGHSRHVYQERADYLSRFAARLGLDDAPANATPLSLEEWLQEGIEYYVAGPVNRDGTRGEPKRLLWHAPFVRTEGACTAN